MAGPPMGPFAMPMYRAFVPKPIRPWIYVFFAFIFQLTGSLYAGALPHIMGSTALMREDVMMVVLCNVVGVNMPFPLLFRFKFRFTNRQLLLTAAAVIAVCNFLCIYITSLPVLCILSFVAGFFKLCGTFECASNIQLWMTPKRDFAIFFPLLYIIVVGDICLQPWLTTVLTYHFQSWYAMHWFMIGCLMVVMLLVFTLTKNFRFMKPIPLISVDWLGCLLWSAWILEIIFIFNYGEYYNWWDGQPIRFCTLLCVITGFFTIGRMMHIRHPYIELGAFQYKTLLPLMLLYYLSEVMNSTPKSLQNVLTGSILHWGNITTCHLYLWEWLGTALGCLFVLLWMKVLKQTYTRLLTIGFAAMLAYQVAMYFYIDPGLNIERLYLPTVTRCFGYAIYFTALTIYLEELMPFNHFFMGLTISGFARNGIGEAMSGGLYSYSMRHQVADNIARTLPLEPTQSMMVALKQLFGYTCMGGVIILLVFLLWDVPPVRKTLKIMPRWKSVGKRLRNILLRNRND